MVQTTFYLPIFVYKPKKVVLVKFGLVNGKEKTSPVKYLTPATMPGTAHSFSTYDSLREVAGAEAPPLKKFSSKVQGKIFPFSYLTISNFSIRSAG